MRVTYLNHSGFLIEFGETAFLFDYYKHDIPDLSRFMNVYVFVSHKHADHYNPDIFLLKDMYDNVFYILSEDIRLIDQFENKELKKEDVLFVKEDMYYEMHDFFGNKLHIQTIHSTDEGVAFYLEYKKKTIYHAGDLNLWVWQEESKSYNDQMRKSFSDQMEKLAGKHIDVAFAPLDPRQEDDYALGMLALLKIADIKNIFPMHFWDKPEIISRFLKEFEPELLNCKLMKIEADGDEFYIE